MKSLIEACLDAFKTGDVIAAQDMGAAGLTCSSAEMAANGNLGISIDLDLVPSREDNVFIPILLSESQERMLFVAKEKINSLIEKFNKWGLYANVIGEVIDTNEIIISHKGKIVAQIPTAALSDDTPVNVHKVISDPPNYLLKMGVKKVICQKLKSKIFFH